MANEKKLQCYGFVDKVINSSFAPNKLELSIRNYEKKGEKVSFFYFFIAFYFFP